MAPTSNHHRPTQFNLRQLDLKCDKHHNKPPVKQEFVPINTQLQSTTLAHTTLDGSQSAIALYITILRVENMSCRQDKLLDEARDYLKFIYEQKNCRPLIVEVDAKFHKWDDNCKIYLIPGYIEELIKKCKRIESSRIVLPKVLLEMKDRGIESIPSRKILTTMCMCNMRIHLTAMKKTEKIEKTKKLLLMGATPVPVEELSTCHFVISALACSEVTIQASEKGRFVFGSALIETLFNRSIDDKQDFISAKDFSGIVTQHRMKPFHGVRFSVIGHSSDELELIELMKENGAKYILQNDKPENVNVLLDLQAGQNFDGFVPLANNRTTRRINAPFVRACVAKKRFLSHDFYLKNISTASQMTQMKREFPSPEQPRSLCANPEPTHQYLEEEFETKMDVTEPMVHMPEKPPSMTLQEIYDGIYEAVVQETGHLHTQAIPTQMRQFPSRQVRVDPVPELASQRIIWKEKL